jgi:septal ring factor EnvC (AmiA/AmiB activator)
MNTTAFAVVFSVLLCASVLAAPQENEPEESMKRMQTVLGVLNQELTATYDQIKALQTALEANERTSQFPRWRSPDIVTVDEVVAAKRKANAREQEIQTQIDAAFSRIKDIESQKQPILRRLQDFLDAEKETESTKAPSR